MNKSLKVNLSSAQLHHLVRYGYLLLATLLVTHFFIYQKLPFQVGYRFPWNTYLVISGMAAMICAGNWWVFQKVNVRSDKTFLKAVFAQLAVNTLASTLLYTFVYLLVNQLLFSSPWVAVSFFKYLLICLVVSGSYVVLLTARSLYRGNQEMPRSRPGGLLIKHNKRHLRVAFEDVQVATLNSGVIMIQTGDGRRLISQFSSLRGLAELLPVEDFFQVNRQLIIHRSLIREVRRLDSRQLELTLKSVQGGFPQTFVSRYKAADFIKWYEGKPGQWNNRTDHRSP